jgi:putative endonuclease
MDANWMVYIMKCVDNTLYTGITTDIDRRLDEHNNSKKAAVYTKCRRPITLHYLEGPMTKSEALKREIKIKNTTKQQKEAMKNVEGDVNNDQ